ncbi:Oidioi.mRNA.OKI2018_I69.chr1.g2767.t1.cds [Oikopleura dioica]|uniref:Oidioi.mRNA.OKI2018_I69.chr1.g2767.t1.cds n=1 Tax=Oikopleura dioica TaxID=34765 RepID=A0ABN7SXD1_OIKDI|nr:Oidioi.mRNA.OKI2018_I69.chr1.g2767.t1.cds [Oikopleura dioica]
MDKFEKAWSRFSDVPFFSFKWTMEMSDLPKFETLLRERHDLPLMISEDGNYNISSVLQTLISQHPGTKEDYIASMVFELYVLIEGETPDHYAKLLSPARDEIVDLIVNHENFNP